MNVAQSERHDAVRTERFHVRTSPLFVGTTPLSVRTTRLSVRTTRLSVRTTRLSVRTTRLSVRTTRLSVRTTRLSVRTTRLSVRTKPLSSLATPIRNPLRRPASGFCLDCPSERHNRNRRVKPAHPAANVGERMITHRPPMTTNERQRYFQAAHPGYDRRRKAKRRASMDRRLAELREAQLALAAMTATAEAVAAPMEGPRKCGRFPSRTRG